MRKQSTILILKTHFCLFFSQWYKEEHGVEVRRCLGILSEIVLVSKFAASVVSGNVDPSEAALMKHKFTEVNKFH